MGFTTEYSTTHPCPVQHVFAELKRKLLEVDQVDGIESVERGLEKFQALGGAISLKDLDKLLSTRVSEKHLVLDSTQEGSTLFASASSVNVIRCLKSFFSKKRLTILTASREMLEVEEISIGLDRLMDIRSLACPVPSKWMPKRSATGLNWLFTRKISSRSGLPAQVWFTLPVFGKCQHFLISLATFKVQNLN